MSATTMLELRRPIGGCPQRILHARYGEGPWRCGYCERQVLCSCYQPTALYRAATVDHVYPVIRGGSNAPENCVPACYPCNTGKGMALYPAEWTPERGLDVQAVGATPPPDPGGLISYRAHGLLAFIQARPDVPIPPNAL